MKKVYKKPIAVVEDFMLSQHIAACDMNVNSTSSAGNNVEFVIEDLRFAGYFTGESVCENDFENAGTVEIYGEVYCYHTSVDTSTVDGVNIFIS